MKLYGYSDDYRKEDDPKMHTLGEVTLSASPEELRKIANFLMKSASEMENNEADFGHKHLSDFDDMFSDKRNIIIAKSKKPQQILGEK